MNIGDAWSGFLDNILHEHMAICDCCGKVITEGYYAEGYVYCKKCMADKKDIYEDFVQGQLELPEDYRTFNFEHDLSIHSCIANQLKGKRKTEECEFTINEKKVRFIDDHEEMEFYGTSYIFYIHEFHQFMIVKSEKDKYVFKMKSNFIDAVKEIVEG